MVESRNVFREKLKSDYSLLQSSDLRVEITLKLSTVNSQLSTLKLSTVNCQLSNCQLSTVNCQLSNCQLSTVNC
ncbi:MAG: hypothetical protein JGK08_28180 [Microcoleus sp. PH2017_04_SCI_O_A]|nr:hypothetical protein [Microcoleus sp. PH2017_04_SCI_O_A]